MSPFKSTAQRKFLFAKHPEVAAKWAKETPKGAALPAHVKAGAMKALKKRGGRHA